MRIYRDMTERKQTEGAWKIFHSLLDQLSDAIEVSDPATLRFLDCNRRAYQTLGYSRDEFLSLNLFAVDPSIDQSRLSQINGEIEKSGFAIFESLRRRKDGSTFTVEVNVKMIRLEKDYRFAVVRDITERKRAENALKESEDSNLIIARTASDAIITIDEESTILFVNSAAERIFGYTSEEMLGRQLTLLMPEYLRHLHQAGIRRYVETGKKHTSWKAVELPGLHKSGREIPLELSFGEFTRDGKHVFTGIARDITERKLGEEALRKSEAQYHRLIETAYEGVMMFDSEMRITYVNQRLAEMFGVSAEELIGTSAQEFVADAARADVEQRWRHRAEGVKEQYDLQLFRRDGTELWVIVSATPIFDEQGEFTGTLSLLTDITERNRVEEKLSESERQLSEAQRLARVGNWNWDLQNNVLSWSDELYRIFGVDRQIYKPDYEDLASKFAHAEDRALLSGAIEGSLRCKEPHNFYWRIIRADGEERVIHSIGQIVSDEQGNPVRMFGSAQDVTERKLAEEALKESQRRLEEAQRIAHVGHWERDLETERITWSDEIYRILGLPPQEHGSSLAEWLHAIHPEDREKVILAVEEAKNDVRRFDLEYRILRPDGEVRFLHSQGDIIRDEHGRPRRVFGIAQDITERKWGEQRLREYEKAVEGLDEMIVVVDRDYRCLLANRAFLSYRGLEREQLEERLVPELLSPGVFENAVKEKLDECFKGNVVKYEMRYSYPTLGERDLFISYFPIEGRTGIERVACILKDITESKRAEEQLRLSESQFAEAQRLAHIGSWSLDIRSNTVTCSDELYRIFGVQPSEFDHRYEEVIRITHPEDRDKLRSIIENSLKTHEPFSVYYRITLPTGELRVLHARGAVVVDEHGNASRLHGTAQDVTERIQAEERLRATTEQLRALSARLQSAREEEGTRIAREIHDELGAAMTSLRWGLESLDKVISEPGSQSRLQLLREMVKDMLRLTDATISTVRRISSELRPSVLDDLGLSEAIEWQAQQFQARTGIICQCDCSLENPDFSQEQSTAVFRILQEALTNVLRHAQATRVEIKIKKEAGEFILTISDNGRGITEDEKADHLSLGLVGMRERSYLVGGNINITGVEGMGTVVTVRIPIFAQANH